MQATGIRITETRDTEFSSLTEARVQAPRSLWDPTYDEDTWVSQAAGGPVRSIDRLRESTALHYPGTKLAISEYYFGGGNQISGGVAEADVLGIFGREGLFAAAVWPATSGSNFKTGDDGRGYAYVFGAFDMYLNYDGAGSRFGDTGLRSSTSDPVRSSVYASVDSAQRIVVVAINKTAAPLPASIAVSGRPVAKAQTYTLTSGSPYPRAQGEIVAANGQLRYTMPPMSVSTLVIAP